MVILRKVFFPYLNVTAVITERTVKSKLACRAKEQIIRTCKSHKLVAKNTVYAFLRNLEPVLSQWSGHHGGVATGSTILLCEC